MVAADRRKFGARPRFEAALGGDLGGDDRRFARPFASKSFGFRRGNNGARPFRRTLLHQHDKAFAVAGRARHVEGRGLANPIAELVDGADDIRIGYAAPGILASQYLNRAGAGTPPHETSRRPAAAASDLDRIMAASL